MNIFNILKKYYRPKEEKVNRPKPPTISFNSDDDPYHYDYNARARAQINDAYDGENDAKWNID